MARPKKNTVDYFPHECNHSTELEIILQQYGNEGYAFYYRLREVLGRTPNHIIKCDSELRKQSLSASTGIEKESMMKIIELMVDIELIDRELWEEHSTIWCDDFVQNVRDVNEHRTT